MSSFFFDNSAITAIHQLAQFVNLIAVHVPSIGLAFVGLCAVHSALSKSMLPVNSKPLLTSESPTVGLLPEPVMTSVLPVPVENKSTQEAPHPIECGQKVSYLNGINAR